MVFAWNEAFAWSLPAKGVDRELIAAAVTEASEGGHSFGRSEGVTDDGVVAVLVAIVAEN